LTDTIAPPVLLIASDQADVRSGLAVTLTSHGLRHIESVSLARAIDAAARVIPDVALVVADEAVDYAPPVIRQLREDIATRHTPIVVRIASTRQEAVDTLLGAGADRVLFTTADPATVVNTVIRLSAVTPPCRALRELRRSLAEVRARTLAQATNAAAVRTRQGQLAAALQQFRMSMIASDSSGRCVAVNAAACRVSGFSRDELVGEPMWHLALRGAGRGLRAGWSSLLVVGMFEGRCELRRKTGAPVAADLYAAAHVLPDLHVAAIQPSTT
jgi:PAS domain-containing protein